MIKQLIAAAGKAIGGKPDLTFQPARDGFGALMHRMEEYFMRVPEERDVFESEIAYLRSTVASRTADEQLLYAVLPYPFAEKYDWRSVPVFRDHNAGMFYVMLDGKRLYYHSGFQTVESVQKSFTYVCAEQDIESPHRYCEGNFSVSVGDVVVDLGAAEGNFALMSVESAAKLFVVESDQRWLEALRKTFLPWRDKVQIIHKSVGDSMAGDSVTLAGLCGGRVPNFIKMDIEGAEVAVIRQSVDFLRSGACRLAIATYHRHDDGLVIGSLLQKAGFSTRFTPRYLLNVYDVLRPPYFRKAILRAEMPRGGAVPAP